MGLMKSLGVIIASALVVAFVWTIFTTNSSAAFGGRGGDMWGPHSDWHGHWHGPNMSPWHRQRMRRHWQFMHGQIPDEYQNLRNPHDYTPEVISAGARIYTKHCAQCHGAGGMGDGEAAKDLNPSPSLLAFLIQRPIAVDQYLMWTISEGGKEFGTDMPAFKKLMNKDDIWKVIAYMRSSFPFDNGNESQRED